LPRYTSVAGEAKLREAIGDYHRRVRGAAYTAKEVVVSAGAKLSLYQVTQALCRAGDEVILPSPYWVTYREQAMMAGASVCEVVCPQSTNFLLQPEQLAEAITPSTRMVRFEG
jgi:aspartate/methionine/tyrosine aminotransferase